MPHIHPISVCAPSPPLYVSPKGRGEPLLLPSTVLAYAPLISVLLLRKGVPVCQPLAEPAPLPLPQFSALTLQQGVHPLQPLSVCAPTPLSVSLQGIGVTPLLPSSMHGYPPLLW